VTTLAGTAPKRASPSSRRNAASFTSRSASAPGVLRHSERRLCPKLWGRAIRPADRLSRGSSRLERRLQPGLGCPTEQPSPQPKPAGSRTQAGMPVLLIFVSLRGAIILSLGKTAPLRSRLCCLLHCATRMPARKRPWQAGAFRITVSRVAKVGLVVGQFACWDSLQFVGRTVAGRSEAVF
jgi:hypothetical protein